MTRLQLNYFMDKMLFSLDKVRDNHKYYGSIKLNKYGTTCVL